MKTITRLLLLGIAFHFVSCDKDTVTEDNTNSKSATVATLATTPKKFLFDATKAETAGNADWVLDADTNPQRFPTPARCAGRAARPAPAKSVSSSRTPPCCSAERAALHR